MAGQTKKGSRSTIWMVRDPTMCRSDYRDRSGEFFDVGRGHEQARVAGTE